jgi:ubiquitin-activating enzyme E1
MKEKFESDYGIEVSMITYGTSTIYTSFGKDSKARLVVNVKDAIENVTKKQIPGWKTILPIGISGNTNDGTDCLLPDVRYHL